MFRLYFLPGKSVEAMKFARGLNFYVKNCWVEFVFHPARVRRCFVFVFAFAPVRASRYWEKKWRQTCGRDSKFKILIKILCKFALLLWSLVCLQVRRRVTFMRKHDKKKTKKYSKNESKTSFLWESFPVLSWKLVILSLQVRQWRKLKNWYLSGSIQFVMIWKSFSTFGIVNSVQLEVKEKSSTWCAEIRKPVEGGLSCIRQGQSSLDLNYSLEMKFNSIFRSCKCLLAGQRLGH